MQIKGNTFLIWRKADTANFELKLEYKIVGGNSGIQYRSFEVPDNKWVIGGYQGDFEAGDTFSGINYGERFRGILCLRGKKTVIGADHKPKEIETIGDTKELQGKIKKEEDCAKQAREQKLGFLKSRAFVQDCVAKP